MRSLIFLAFTLAYAAVWLALAMLCSILFRSAATAALVTLGVWLFLSVLWPMLAPALAQIIAPSDLRSQLIGIPSLPTLEWQQGLARLSPNHLYGEICGRYCRPPSARSIRSSSTNANDSCENSGPK